MNEAEIEDALSSPRTHALFRCVGCGAMGFERECTGDCDYRKLVVVEAELYADIWETRENAKELLSTCRELLDRIARLPNGEALQGAYPELQAQARALLREAPKLVPVEIKPEDERFTLWRCMACGQAEAPRECIDVCVRPVRDYVEEADYLAMAEAAKTALAPAQEVYASLRDLAWTRPRADNWDAALQRLRQAATSEGATERPNFS